MWFSNFKKRFNEFSEVTKFRLISFAMFMFGMELILSVLVQLQGQYLKIESWHIEAATILGIVFIFKELGQKLIPYIMANMKLSYIFKVLIILDFIWAIGTLFYFYNITYMIWFDTMLGMFHTIFVVAYSFSLNNYIVYFENDKYSKFQNFRNELGINVSLVALSLSVVLSAISISFNIIAFLIVMFGFVLYRIININIFDKNDFKYLLNYKKSMKND